MLEAQEKEKKEGDVGVQNEGVDADELSLEEITQKLAELSRQRKEIMDKLYPEAELSPEEKGELQQQLTVIEAEIKAFEKALEEEVAPDQEETGKPRGYKSADDLIQRMEDLIGQLS